MKHTKRLTSAILATVMILALLIPAAVLPATATETETDDLSKQLYFHFDFNSADPDLAVQDKAPTGEGYVSKVADTLTMSGSSLGTDNAPGTTWAIAPNFEFNGFSVSATDRRAALKAASSADLQAIQTAGTNSTWFVRFKMDGFESESELVLSATAVYFGSKSQNEAPDKEASKMAKPFTVSVTKDNLQMQYHHQASSVKSFWEPSEWMNVSLVRTYNEATDDYTYVYTVYNDALQVLKTETVTGGLDTYGTEDLYLFRSPNYGGMSTSEDWSGDT